MDQILDLLSSFAHKYKHIGSCIMRPCFFKQRESKWCERQSRQRWTTSQSINLWAQVARIELFPNDSRTDTSWVPVDWLVEAEKGNKGRLRCVWVWWYVSNVEYHISLEKYQINIWVLNRDRASSCCSNKKANKLVVKADESSRSKLKC